MRWTGLAVLGAGLMGGWAQGPGSGAELIEARQAEVARLGSTLYAIRLDQGRWAHAEVAACPAFTRHVFARYERQDAREAFMAIYDKDVSPAKDKNRPWQGGITLLPLYGIHRGEGLPVAESKAAMEVFNKTWMDERKSSGDLAMFPGISWVELAECYARLIGEQPLPQTGDKPEALPSFDLRAPKVSGVLVPVAGAPGMDRTAYVQFDEQGLVQEAGISAKGTVHTIPQGPDPVGRPIADQPSPVSRPIPVK